MNAIDEKIKVFTLKECLNKAIEEAKEYLKALRLLRAAIITDNPLMHDGQYITDVFCEAADVHVTGFATLSRIWPVESKAYWDKIDEAITVSIPDAIQAKIRQNVANGQHPGEGMTDDEYDTMAGKMGGLF